MTDNSTVPSWSLGVAIPLTMLASVGGTLLYLKRSDFKGFNTDAPSDPVGIVALIVNTVTYIPHIMIMFGVLADMVTQEGVYSIPSLAGLLSVFLSFVMQFFWNGTLEIFKNIKSIWDGPAVKSPLSSSPPSNPFVGSPGALQGKRPERVRTPNSQIYNDQFVTGGAIKNYTGCTVQGLEGWSSPYTIQTLVVTATIFLYYLIDMTKNGSINQAGPVIGLFIIFYLAETYIVSECPGTVSVWLRSFISLLEGSLYSATVYGIVEASNPDKLPSSVLKKTKGESVVSAAASGKKVCNPVPPGTPEGSVTVSAGQSCPAGTA